jgi:hypothetical protein
MSFIDKKAVKCLCGEIFNTEIILSVNLDQTPQLRDIILDGRFNVVECPKCKKLLYVEVPFFYLDSQERMVIYVYPKSYEEEKEKYVKEAEINFTLSMQTIENIGDEQKDYFLQVLFGIEELVKFLLYQEKENDEKEFLEQVYKSLNLKIINFPLNRSRQKNVISKLPYVTKSNKISLDDITEGLVLLLKNYPQLEVYTDFLNAIKFDPKIKENVINLLSEQQL